MWIGPCRPYFILHCFQFSLVLLLLGSTTVVRANDNNGPFEIDHRLSPKYDGIYKRSTQMGLQYALVAGVGSLAIYEGSESRLGRTAWQSLDSMLITATLAQAGKIAFSRERPTETPDAAKFFQGTGHRSFPSGEVANVAAIFTPFVLEYGRENPALVGVAAATLIYDAEARMKVRAHWQSDVIAGALLGAGTGYLMHQRNQSIILVPFGGVFIGYRKNF